MARIVGWVRSLGQFLPFGSPQQEDEDPEKVMKEIEQEFEELGKHIALASKRKILESLTKWSGDPSGAAKQANNLSSLIEAEISAFKKYAKFRHKAKGSSVELLKRLEAGAKLMGIEKGLISEDLLDLEREKGRVSQEVLQLYGQLFKETLERSTEAAALSMQFQENVLYSANALNSYGDFLTNLNKQKEHAQGLLSIAKEGRIIAEDAAASAHFSAIDHLIAEEQHFLALAIRDKSLLLALRKSVIDWEIRDLLCSRRNEERMARLKRFAIKMGAAFSLSFMALLAAEQIAKEYYLRSAQPILDFAFTLEQREPGNRRRELVRLFEERVAQQPIQGQLSAMPADEWKRWVEDLPKQERGQWASLPRATNPQTQATLSRIMDQVAGRILRESTARIDELIRSERHDPRMRQEMAQALRETLIFYRSYFERRIGAEAADLSELPDPLKWIEETLEQAFSSRIGRSVLESLGLPGDAILRLEEFRRTRGAENEIRGPSDPL